MLVEQRKSMMRSEISKKKLQLRWQNFKEGEKSVKSLKSEKKKKGLV